MAKVPLKDAVILTDHATRVLVVAKDDPAVHDRSFPGSFGAVFADWAKKGDKGRMRNLLDLHKQLQEDGIPKTTLHKAFSVIPAYANRNAPER